MNQGPTSVLLIGFFIFMLVISITVSSSQKQLVDSNNFGIRNSTKNSVELGSLRVNKDLSIDEEVLISQILENYVINNNFNCDEITFDVAVKDNIVTVKTTTIKEIFGKRNETSSTFSYKLVVNN
jgi:hypothetical protein